MSLNILEVSKTGLKYISIEEFAARDHESSSAFIYNIISNDRPEVLDHLSPFELPQNILDAVEAPEENIRFRIFNDITFGDLAYFSSGIEPTTKYLGVIIKENVLILIHENEETFAREVKEELSESIHLDSDQHNPAYLLFVLLQVVLADYGKLIISHREEIELLAKDFDKKLEEVNPEEFLEAKSQLSDFSQTFDKMHYTLNFPPVKGIIRRQAEFQSYFTELLKTISLLQLSLAKAEERLNSLHDHYLLLLQDRSNKRINFLTIIQAIFVPLTLLAGIYGMNFEFMPELKIKSAYFIALGSMGVIAIGFLIYFYKNKWFD